MKRALLTAAALLLSACALIDAGTGSETPPLFSRRVDFEAPGVSAMVLADVTGDEVPEVVYADDAGKLWALHDAQRLELVPQLTFVPAVMAVDKGLSLSESIVGAAPSKLFTVTNLTAGISVSERSFTTSDFLVHIVDIALGDLDSDQDRDDIALATSNGNPLVFLGESNEPIEIPLDASFSNAAERVAIGDGDGDGRNDLFALQPGELPQRVALARQTTPGQFAPPQTFAANDDLNTFVELIAADLDGRGGPELLALRDDRVDVFYLPSSLPHTFGPFASDPIGDHAAAGDLVGDDGLLELAVAHSFDESVIVFPQVSQLELGSGQIFALPARPTDVAMGDVDGDGRADVVVMQVARISIWKTAP